jgi:multidrug resistance protein
VTAASAEGRAGHPPRRLPLLFLTVFVDLVGFGIVLPLLPFYADRFGASGLTIGLLVTVYSVAQFFMAPVWGRLSDRFGRRPVLLLGLVGSAVSYLVFAYAASIAALFVSRILAGLGGSTIPVAEAYIADVTPPERRAGNMGLIGAAFGLGFTVGPALGGYFWTVSAQAPGLLAAGLCLSNAVLAFFLLPESRPEPSLARPRRATSSTLGRRGLEAALRVPGLPRILLLYFLFTVAFAVLQPTLSLFGSVRLDLDERQVGYLFAFLGLVSAIVQGGLVRVLVPLLGEARLVRISAVPFVVGLVWIATASSTPALLGALALLAAGYGGTLPSVLSLVSRTAPDTMQGGVLGIGQSVGSLARIVGPALAGALFDIDVGAPFVMGAVLAALGAVAALRLTPAARARSRVSQPETL